MTHLDGNVLAGPTADLFAFETTTAHGQCEACHDTAALAEAMVYGGPMGFVARCRICDNILMVITEHGGRSFLDMRGLRWCRSTVGPSRRRRRDRGAIEERGVGMGEMGSGVAEPPSPAGRVRLTKRGAITRARIVDVAAELMDARGVSQTTLDEIITACRVSKSQLYRHFEDKAALVRAVIDLVGERTMALEGERLGDVKTFAGLQRWRKAIVETDAGEQGRYGSLLGNLVVEVSHQDMQARRKLDDVFRVWCGLFETVFERFRKRGLIPEDAPIVQLATGFVAAVQGGYLLARTAGDMGPMATAIDLSIEHLHLLARTTGATGLGSPPRPARGRS